MSTQGSLSRIVPILTVGTTLLLAACGEAAKLPQIPQLVGPGEPMRASGSVTDVYTRIAQGTRSCWFGADGALKTTHVFHAELAPISKGEIAEITVHEFHPDADARWGKRVFLVTLHPADGQTAIAVENISMPDPIGSQMRTDVFQWSQGGTGCTTRPLKGSPTVTSSTTPPSGQKPQSTPSKPARAL